MTPVDTAIILAAGRGSRLGGLTDDRPKCLVQLQGRPLLHWQVQALMQAGVKRVVIVCGYRADLIQELGLETRFNSDWSRTNMVRSLLCARDLMTGPALVSYSDIVYEPDIIRALRGADRSLAITYDASWLELWSRRFEDPILDAETFRLDASGDVSEIGSRPANLGEIEGQYMGLLKVDASTLSSIEEVVAAEPDEGASLHMTGLLQRLIKRGMKVGAIRVDGGWCEVDNPHDLDVAQALVSEGKIKLPQGIDK